MMVVNNEVFNDISRIIRGIQIDELRVETELIDKVGHMGSFLGERHTMDTVRKGEVRVSSLWDRRSSEKAAREGFKPIQDTAKDVVRKMLLEHQPEPLDRDVARGIEQVVKEAAKTSLRGS
jgi:trimethylamine:corrinoid methyltransferase-like protein